MTINEAARKALVIIGKPAHIDHIYDVIINNNLYTFNTPTPKSVLNNEMNRACKGSSYDTRYSYDYFYKAGPRTFALLERITNPEDLADLEESAQSYLPNAALLDTALFLEIEWQKWLFKNLMENGLEALGFGKCELFDTERQKDNYGKYNTMEVGEIDLLIQNKHGDIIVIELKRSGDDETVGQICRYVGWVEINLIKCDRGKKVYGVIIAQQITPRLKYAIKPIKDYIFYQQLKLNVEFGDSSRTTSSA